jgi:hypothetical protein
MTEHDFFRTAGASGGAHGRPDDERQASARDKGDQPDAQRLWAIGHRIMEQAVEIPDFQLTGQERMHLSSHLFKEAPEFIGSVAEAMEREPALFACFGFRGKALDHKLDRALALGSLSSFFQMMADRTRDLSIYEQADAIHTAMTVVRQVRGENALPIVPPGAEDRKMALVPAEKALRDRQNHKKNAANRRRRVLDRVEETFAAGTGAPGPTTPPSGGGGGKSPAAHAADTAAQAASAAAHAAHTAAQAASTAQAAVSPSPSAGVASGGRVSPSPSAGVASGGRVSPSPSAAAQGGAAHAGVGPLPSRQKPRRPPVNPFVNREVADILSHWNAYAPSKKNPAQDQPKAPVHDDSAGHRHADSAGDGHGPESKRTPPS